MAIGRNITQKKKKKLNKKQNALKIERLENNMFKKQKSLVFYSNFWQDNQFLKET